MAFRDAPTAPVAISRCRSYDEDITALLSTMFDQVGGLGRIVRGKTVTIKLNMTGSPGLRFQGLPLGITHYSHPKMVASVSHLLGQAGARRIRFVESAWSTGGPLEEYMLDSGWNVRSLTKTASGVGFENTNAIGNGKRYARLKVPGGGYIYPAFDLNHAYEDTDVFVSMAKLKEHETCGVTLALKNCFGITPAAVYGDDAGADEPNESPTKGGSMFATWASGNPLKARLRKTTRPAAASLAIESRGLRSISSPQGPSIYASLMESNRWEAARDPGSRASATSSPAS